MSDPIPGEATLREDEYHPAADTAMLWFKMFVLEDPARFLMIKESLASVALSGNRLAELCLSTLNRLADGKPVSDRYLLGLCWFLRENFSERLYEQNEQAVGQKTAKAPKRARQKKNSKA